MNYFKVITIFVVSCMASACGLSQSFTSKAKSTTYVGPEPIQMADHDLLFENRKVSVVGYVQVDLDDIDTTNSEKPLPSVRQMLLEKAKAKFGQVDAVISLAFYRERTLATSKTETITSGFLAEQTTTSGTVNTNSNWYVEAAAVKYVD